MNHSVAIYSFESRNPIGIAEELYQVITSFGARCAQCGELGGAYFTKAGAERIAKEHNTVTVELSRDEFAIFGEALRTAFLATRNPAFAQLLNTKGEDE